MWEDANYCWVVLCKNYLFHLRQNIFFRHRIPLGETDAVAPLPPLGEHFAVRCDDCGETYTYRPQDVRRIGLELPESFKAHPRFQEAPEDEGVNSNRPSQQEQNEEEPPLKQQTRAKGA